MKLEFLLRRLPTQEKHSFLYNVGYPVIFEQPDSPTHRSDILYFTHFTPSQIKEEIDMILYRLKKIR